MLTLDGLRSFNRQGTSLGVVGFPIVHSLSPLFQNAALQHLAIKNPAFRDWEYLKIEAPVEALQEVIALCRQKGFRGLNLTIPHKVEALQYVDKADSLAAKMGAVNTLVFEPDGVTGYNTDGYGISMAVEHELGISIKDRPVVILGAGGAARAASVQCLYEGCSELWVGNRSKARLLALLEDLRNVFPHTPIRGFSLDSEHPAVDVDKTSDGSNHELSRFSKDTLLINATSLGLHTGDPMPISPRLLETVGYVYDMIYGQELTPLVRESRQLGLSASDGLPMLIYQGNRSLSLWTREQVPVDVMRRAVLDHMSDRSCR